MLTCGGVAAESPQPEACDVCGRHMLPGEHARDYLTPDHERRAVCDLCRSKAQRAGWVRADRAPPAHEPPAPEQRPRRLWVIERISQRRARRRREAGREGEAPESEERGAGEPDKEERDKGWGGALQRRKRPRPRSGAEPPERRIRRALDRFNRSEHRRTVEGLTRSLGNPRVAAVTPAEAPDQVRLTVAWELSWYQWKVEFTDGDTAVRALRNGKEVSELGPADRAWNARAGEDGRIQLRVGETGDGEVVAADELG